MFYTTPFFSIYFGDASDRLYTNNYLTHAGNRNLAAHEPYAYVCQTLGVDAITFCHQVHGVDGYLVTRAEHVDPLPFSRKGDFLITNQPIALGVMTADCLPIVLYDPKTHSVAIIHAGWRGALSGVILKAIRAMEITFGISRASLQAFFGPSARACCYEVTSEFMEHIRGYTWHDQVIMTRKTAFFFDLPLCAILLMQEYGIELSAVNTDYNLCTICSMSHCSYRRDNDAAGRQMTVVSRI